MSVLKQEFKKGSKVRIIKGPIDKIGKIGVISFLYDNGAMVKLNKDWFTPIKFEHLERIK